MSKLAVEAFCSNMAFSATTLARLSARTFISLAVTAAATRIHVNSQRSIY